MDMSSTSYSPPLALTVISGVFLALGAVFALVIAIDIVVRRGWRSMMWIMIPVYIVNATYLGPLALLVYFRYGRPSKPTSASSGQSSCHGQPAKAQPAGQSCHSRTAAKEPNGGDHKNTLPASRSCHSWQVERHSQSTSTDSSDLEASAEKDSPSQALHRSCHATSQPAATATAPPSLPSCHAKEQQQQQTEHKSAEPGAAAHGHCHDKPPRPMWATVLVGICHCGAGCVLGDVVGEWIVAGSGWRINGQSVWAELIMDYLWALAFGIVFQYFSIAPMSGEWGLRSVWRAAKADFLSLTSFQVGLFGWMVAYQVGIFGYRLDMQTWTYWWLMQVGMVIGSVTAYPMNWVLITYKVKEPCA